MKWDCHPPRGRKEDVNWRKVLLWRVFLSLCPSLSRNAQIWSEKYCGIGLSLLHGCCAQKKNDATRQTDRDREKE